MLKSNHIPEKEPMIRVGLILPEDRQSGLRLHAPNPVQLHAESGEARWVPAGECRIEVEGDELVIHASSFLFRGKKLSLESTNPGTSMIIGPVTAGRAFHWEKRIDVRVTHRLDITCDAGSLLVINELPLENYLACVATSEMSAACPDSFIEVQTIVARSWMLANVEQKHIRLGFDVCNDDCCQRYQGINDLSPKALETALRSRGKVLISEGRICDARYSKSCGGVTERFENLWEGKSLPYMVNQVDGKDIPLPDLTQESPFETWVHSVPDTFCSPHHIPENELAKYLGKVDEGGKYFRWKKTISQQELLRNVREKLCLDATAILDLIPRKRAGSGRMLELVILIQEPRGQVREISVYKDYEIRKVLDPAFLYSSACTIVKNQDAGTLPDFTYFGAGWGHGAGLCQIGALGMSLDGYSSESILTHYYPGTKLKKIYR